MLSSDIDLLNPPAELEKTKHKRKRLVQSPNSVSMILAWGGDLLGLRETDLPLLPAPQFFMDVKCQGCFNM